MEPSVNSRSALSGQAVLESWLPQASRDLLWGQGARLVKEGWVSYDDITAELSSHGVEIVPYRIDVEAFWRYVEDCGYREMEYWQGGKRRVAAEKWLEHFVSIDLLSLQASDVVIDVASCTSPFPDIVRQLHGCCTYRQDWLFPAGVEGDRIGGDAAAMPVPAEFADKLALHCSFEHFEGDRDAGFLRETERILRPGGRLCILPFYTNHVYCIQTDLEAWRYRRPEFENDALICVAKDWGEVHGRFYDPRHFFDRVVDSLGSLRLQIIRIENYSEVAEDCYLRFAALITKP